MSCVPRKLEKDLKRGQELTCILGLGGMGGMKVQEHCRLMKGLTSVQLTDMIKNCTCEHILNFQCEIVFI